MSENKPTLREPYNHKEYQHRYYIEHRPALLKREKENREGTNYYNTEKAKKARVITHQRMKEKYPEKHKARYMAKNAVSLGKLEKQPCEVCGSLDVEMHHDDYSKPLEGRWFVGE